MVMPQEFDQFELPVKAKVRFFRNDTPYPGFEYVEMGKKPRRRVIWYVKEWLAAKGLRQADLVSRTEFSKSQVSEYVNGVHRFNEDVLVIFADAIGIEPIDLLRPPSNPENELAAYVLKLDKTKRIRALRVLRAAMADEEEHEDGKKIA